MGSSAGNWPSLHPVESITSKLAMRTRSQTLLGQVSTWIRSEASEMLPDAKSFLAARCRCDPGGVSMSAGVDYLYGLFDSTLRYGDEFQSVDFQLAQERFQF